MWKLTGTPIHVCTQLLYSGTLHLIPSSPIHMTYFPSDAMCPNVTKSHIYVPNFGVFLSISIILHGWGHWEEYLALSIHFIIIKNILLKYTKMVKGRRNIFIYLLKGIFFTWRNLCIIKKKILHTSSFSLFNFWIERFDSWFNLKKIIFSIILLLKKNYSK